MIPTERQLWILRTMIRIRTFEERVGELYPAGKLPGFVHLYIGEEAVAAGVCAVLHKEDYITSTHRGHGHAIAKGAGLKQMMAELYGKSTGCCRGKGGSMHVADFGVGMLGANGIVGGGLGIASGAGLSAKAAGKGQVAVCFFGDGASNKGVFHESLNLASILKLPVVFVAENNQYAQFTRASYSLSSGNVADRGAGYSVPAQVADGNDAEEVYRAAHAAVLRAREGQGPSLIEAKTYRHRGHYVGDPEAYRTKAEVEEWKAKCPIKRWEAKLLGWGTVSKTDLAQVWEDVRAEVREAEHFAENSPDPDPSEAFTGLFA